VAFKTQVVVNLRLEVELYKSGKNHKEYTVRLLEGKWPKDDLLIDWVDGGDPLSPWNRPLHDGGEVILTDDLNVRQVIVR
jgi:hypothetical protein